MVVEVDIAVNHFISFRKCNRFIEIDTLCLEDGKEISRHGVVIQVFS